jgi:glycerol uptake facilitator-like aquaporin
VDWLQVLGGVAVGVVGAAVAAAVLWCLYDILFKATDAQWSQKLLWVVLLLSLNVLGAILYVRIGPGRSRWAPWRMWTGAGT